MIGWHKNDQNFRHEGWHLCVDRTKVQWQGDWERVPDLAGGFFESPTISNEEMDRMLAKSHQIADMADLCYRRGINPLPLFRRLTPSLCWEYVRDTQFDPYCQSGSGVIASFRVKETGNCRWDWIVARIN